MTTPHNALPIGVFDSGLGGLTVAREIRRALPNENILYLGDSARVPYGTRSASTVIRYAQTCASFLTSQCLKMLVVACNSASAVAMPTLRAASNLPIHGVIAAGAHSVAATGARTVGVIGTAGTIGSDAYVRELAQVAPDCQVYQNPAPLLVPLAEEGWTEGELPVLAATRYVAPLVERNMDVLLLGCTHYPLLKGAISQALDALGSRAEIIDSARAMAADVKHSLDDLQLHNPHPEPRGKLKCYVTDRPASFEEVATRFLGERLEQVEVVDI